jgi:hypothetical protein
MDFYIEWIYHDSFFKEAKKQVIEIFGPKCSPFIKLKLLYVSVAGGSEYGEDGRPSVYKVDEKGFPYYCLVSIDIKPCYGVLNNMQLHWRAEDDTVVFPNDDISDKKVTFWVENIPSDEKIKEKFARNEYLWKREKTEYLIDKKAYRFKTREFGWFATSFPDINIKIKSTASLKNLNSVVGNAISTFNREGEIDEGENGLIHYFDSKKKKKDVYYYTIDTGSAFIGGVEAILKALNDSDLVIEYITLG